MRIESQRMCSVIGRKAGWELWKGMAWLKKGVEAEHPRIVAVTGALKNTVITDRSLGSKPLPFGVAQHGGQRCRPWSPTA